MAEDKNRASISLKTNNAFCVKNRNYQTVKIISRQVGWGIGLNN